MTNYDDFARYYDADFQGYTDDVPLYRQMAQRTGGPLIELMCGTGRVLVPLAEDGYHITGVDISPSMLEIARARLEQHNLLSSVSLITGDVRSVKLPAQTFALAFVAINSFMHLERVSDQLAALETIRQTLTPDGLLIIDLFNPNPSEIINEDNRLILERHYPLDGRHVYKTVAVDSDIATQTSHVTCFYDETNLTGPMSRRVMHFTLRWLYRYELEHLLARAGFMLKSLYGSYDLERYTSTSERLIALAALR
jgi:ubiquinone/menaquinone biosynthesis C-methylase UbiE